MSDYGYGPNGYGSSGYGSSGDYGDYSNPGNMDNYYGQNNNDVLSGSAVIAASYNGAIHVLAVGTYQDLSNKQQNYQDLAPDGANIKVISTSGLNNIDEIIKDPKLLTSTFENFFLI